MNYNFLIKMAAICWSLTVLVVWQNRDVITNFLGHKLIKKISYAG